MREMLQKVLNLLFRPLAKYERMLEEYVEKETMKLFNYGFQRMSK